MAFCKGKGLGLKRSAKEGRRELRRVAEAASLWTWQTRAQWSNNAMPQVVSRSAWVRPNWSRPPKLQSQRFQLYGVVSRVSAVCSPHSDLLLYIGFHKQDHTQIQSNRLLSLCHSESPPSRTRKRVVFFFTAKLNSKIKLQIVPGLNNCTVHS